MIAALSFIIASRLRVPFLMGLALSIPAVFGLGLTPAAAKTTTKTIKLVAFGDSLTAGYLLPADAAFPAVLEKALRGAGYDVRISNAGVSGDTAEDGLARLDWALQDGADGVILELGANDMLRGIDPTRARATLDTILAKLASRHVKVLMAGMLASPSLGAEYGRAFDAIYPALAAKYKVPLYPFFLQGVAGNKSLQLADGLHPNREGVQKIVAQMLPLTENFLHAIAAQ
jgi:acyl-CoA thioesterase I